MPGLFDAARQVLRTLHEARHEAWLVGGSVRDHLLGTDAEDITEFDVVTSARPEQVEGLFRRTFAVGKAFGVVRVGLGPHWLEVATFRTEEDYRDGRHPSKVRFATAQEDVHRRDFTVNGLLWDPEGDVIRDHVGGRADLERRLIRAIGDPEERLAEDGLRLLRAVRFGAWKQFRLEPSTEAAVRRQRERIRVVSPERLRDELAKIATRASSRRGDAWRLLVSTGLAEMLLPLRPTPEQAEDDARVLDALAHRDLSGFLAVVMRNACSQGSPPAVWRAFAERVADDLRCSTEEKRSLSTLLGDRARYRNLDRLPLSRQRLAATRADRNLHEDLLRAEGDAPHILALLDEDRAQHGAERPAPLVDGRTLIAHGHTPGPLLGWALRRIRVKQLRGDISTWP